MSAEHKRYVKKLKIRHAVIWVLRIGLLAAFLGIWELVAHYRIVDPFIISSPSRIVRLIGELYRENNLFPHILASLYETVLGFVIATVLGSLIAMALWWSKGLRDVLEPYLITLNSLPKIALGPIIIIWAGAGKNAIIAMAVLICIVITVISMLTGFESVDKEKIMLLRSMHATKGQIFRKLVFPANMPNLISVLKINVGLSWVGTIMGEYLVSREGIGYLIVYGSQVFQLDLVMASTVVLCVLAAVMYGTVALLEKIIKIRYSASK